MDRRRGLVIVVSVLGVIALTFAAATLTNPELSTEGSSGAGSEGNGSGLFSPPEREDTIDVQLPSFIQPVFTTLLVVLALLAIVVAVFTFSSNEYLRILLIALGIALFGWLLVQALELLLGGLGGGGGLLPEGEGGSFGPNLQAPDRPTTIADVPIFVWLGLGLVVLVGLLTIVRLSSDASTSFEKATSNERGKEHDLEAVGEAAGRAATRLVEGADATNAVYRAWREMTEALEVSNPESTTPAEFERAAIAAGMARDDVHELTRLFEEVRYGDAPVSVSRERRARRALEHIESTYADLDAEGVLEESDRGGTP